jgi:hypothetical protein
MPKTLPPVALKSGKTALPPEYCIVLKCNAVRGCIAIKSEVRSEPLST